MGTRGLGEGLPGLVPAALSNAISDALLPFGIEITELPLRANRIWAAIQAATQQAAE
jgi:carbon-monoxide dehydrogenase large subunit